MSKPAPFRLLALAAALTLGLAPEAQAQRLAGARPDPTTDEGGLWDRADKAEQSARRSAELNQDPALNAYVREVTCKVAKDHCGDVRVYVMDRPFFNAGMSPNGYTEIWSGALLRTADEAELAFIIGHEVSHFDHNHSLSSWRRTKTTANAIMLLQIGIGVAGAAAAAGSTTSGGYSSTLDATRGLMDVVYLAGVATLFGFSREHELEADRLGLQRSLAAGYSPHAALAVWRGRMDEAQASDFKRVRSAGARTNIFDSHPVDAERLRALESQLQSGQAAGEGGRERHRAAIRPHLAAWLRQDLQRRDFGQTLHLIGRLAASGEDLGVLNFYRGEAYRQRAEDGDLAKAHDAYLEAAAHADAPVAAWRELGEARRKQGDAAGSRTAFETYLAKAPGAEDAWLVQDSLNSLKSGS